MYRELQVRSVAWSPDGLLASGSADKTIKIWDKNYKCIAELEHDDDWVTAVAWSPDGLLASGSYDNIVKIWDKALNV